MLGQIETINSANSFDRERKLEEFITEFCYKEANGWFITHIEVENSKMLNMLQYIQFLVFNKYLIPGELILDGVFK